MITKNYELIILDNRVNFAHEWMSGVLLDDDWSLRSYAVIGQDNCFNKNMAKYMQLNEKSTITLMYLFTVENQRKNDMQNNCLKIYVSMFMIIIAL